MIIQADASRIPLSDKSVLDPFAGSGTVGVVAQKYNRRAVLLELKMDYIKMAKKRIKETNVAMI